MKWWKERFVNRRDYILEKMETWNLRSEELLVILLIDYFNEHQLMITLQTLAAKMDCRVDEVDEILENLKIKGYVDVRIEGGKLCFVIDGLFEEKVQPAASESIFDIYETEFGRPLSRSEMQRLADFMQQYEEEMILNALREALIYGHKNFDYIEQILIQWKKKGLSADDYAEGRR